MTSVKTTLVLCLLSLGALAPAVQAANPIVVIDTSMGPIKVELLEDKAPITVKNFLDYIDKKQYDGTIFHRVMDGFMIQGGGFEPDGKNMKEKETGKPIKNEAGNGLSNLRGTLAMARTNDPDSATAQFFINVVNNNRSLDRSPNTGAGYAVFGRVVDGMDVVDKIKGVKTGAKLDGRSQPHQNVPVENVMIKSITREKK